MTNTQVTHAIHGYKLKLGYVQKRMAESCSFVWVVVGKTFRNATYEEAMQMREEQARLNPCQEREVLGTSAEIPGLRFEAPATTYQTPRQAYEELAFDDPTTPVGVRTCHWPRQSWPLITEANRLAAQHAS